MNEWYCTHVEAEALVSNSIAIWATKHRTESCERKLQTIAKALEEESFAPKVLFKAKHLAFVKGVVREDAYSLCRSRSK